MTELKLRPYPTIDVSVHPAAAPDTRTKRILDKELRAAGWNGRAVRWVTGSSRIEGPGPALCLSCHGDMGATALAALIRIGLAHFVASIRSRLPDWVVTLAVRGRDGNLQLKWGLDVGLHDAAQSLMGRVPRQGEYESEGGPHRAEADGGISLLGLGAWEWNPASNRWQSCGE